ncbi:MAG: FAD binding domain-containing protein [Myxococcota bacterium]
MLPFPALDHVAPASLAEALDAYVPGAILVAGGTDLLPSVKHRLFQPRPLVSLRRVAELHGVTETADGLALGAGLTLRRVARLVRDRYPALADACETVATPTIQAMGTLGGNVMLDTRCVYYNQPEGWRAAIGGCLKAEGSVCHVAPKGTGCYAAHSADTVPVLWLLDARLELASREGVRQVAIHDMYRPEGRRWHKALPGEILTRVLLPRPAAAVVHRKGRTRAAIDYGWLVVAASRDPSGYRAVVSAVGPEPVEVRGASPAELAEAAFRAVQPLATHLQPATWRKKMVRVEVRRAAESLG